MVNKSRWPNFLKNVDVPQGGYGYYFWQQIKTTKKCMYYLHTSGVVAVVYNGNKKVKVLKKQLIYKRTNSNPYVVVKLGAKYYKLKNLVAHAIFMDRYHKGISIVHKDGNPLNCDCFNLRLVHPKILGAETGGLTRLCNPVSVDGIKYKSVRSAAKALFVSYQTLLDYIKAPSKRKSLYPKKIYKLKTSGDK